MNTKEELLQTVKKLRKANVSGILRNLPTKRSRQWVSLLLNELAKNNELLKEKKGREVWYVLPENREFLSNIYKSTLKNSQLQEHIIFENIQEKLAIFDSLNENLQSILYYAFTEMVNNAIEHSQSPTITVIFGDLGNDVFFEVIDRGIGVYNNIREKKHLKNNLEAIQELLKGKTTTLPHSHSGEGIFFTSKIADKFELSSYEYNLIVENRIDDVFVEEINSKKGTYVRFEINKKTKKHLNDTFKEYQSEPDSLSFDKTKIHIKLYKAGTIFISRSQARRLTTNLEKFRKIVLDFNGVKTIGQAFADEIFRIFTSKYPGIKIEPINTNQVIDFMIKRAQKS